MPNQPKTPLRNFRAADDIWQPAQARAAAEGTNVTAVLVAYLKRYGKDYRQPSEKKDRP